MEKIATVQKTTKKAEQTIPFYGLNGAVESQVIASKELFNIKTSDDLVTKYIRIFRINQRQGTASTKTRAEVKGTTKKMYKQKGTGKARHGSYKAPIFKGGGVVGGPKPKEYDLRINKKQKKIVFASLLSAQFAKKNVIGLSEKALSESKTKTVYTFLKKMEFIGKKVICIFPQKDTEFKKAVRNIDKVTVTRVEELNAFDLISNEKIIFIGNALSVLEKTMSL